MKDNKHVQRRGVIFFLLSEEKEMGLNLIVLSGGEGICVPCFLSFRGSTNPLT